MGNNLLPTAIDDIHRELRKLLIGPDFDVVPANPFQTFAVQVIQAMIQRHR